MSPIFKKTIKGTAIVELLIAIPITLLLGFGVLQLVLVFFARSALSYAIVEATKAGSVAHAAIDKIELGLARGLAPYWGKIPTKIWKGPSSYLAELVSYQKLLFAKKQGWLEWRQLSPTRQSFQDWGRPITGVPYTAKKSLEIPNDNLHLVGVYIPKSGVSLRQLGAPVGIVSGESLRDANLFKLELRYGVPMIVPFVGALSARLMQKIDGCSSTEHSSLEIQYLALRHKKSSWRCSFYFSKDWHGHMVPRWPIRVSGLVRMHSTARLHEKVLNQNEVEDN